MLSWLMQMHLHWVSKPQINNAIGQTLQTKTMVSTLPLPDLGKARIKGANSSDCFGKLFTFPTK